MPLVEFFDGVRSGRAVVQRCRACGELTVPPKAFCPVCRAMTWEPAPLSGEGEIVSYTVIRVPPATRTAEAPYAVVVVRMREGVSLLGRIRGLPLEGLRVGLPVHLVPPADPAATPPVITFAPREAGRAA